ncbi:MAG: hypothetical protein WBG34_05465 [Flavobacteriales bacterium]
MKHQGSADLTDTALHFDPLTGAKRGPVWIGTKVPNTIVRQ